MWLRANPYTASTARINKQTTTTTNTIGQTYNAIIEKKGWLSVYHMNFIEKNKKREMLPKFYQSETIFSYVSTALQRNYAIVVQPFNMYLKGKALRTCIYCSFRFQIVRTFFSNNVETQQRGKKKPCLTNSSELAESVYT